MITWSKRSRYTVFVLFCIISVMLVMNASAVQDDPILAPDLTTLPVFDGVGDDACWQDLPWQSIDQVWIEYGSEYPVEDFTGRFKLAWSSQTNLLYFLAEITDDVLVGGFKPDGSAGSIPDFDVFEVFIDEDKSGGLHVFDGTGDTGAQWGTNAENAFSYHMFSEFLEDDSVNTEVYADDLDGWGWWPAEASWRPDYSSHVPDFAMRKHGNTVVREFSLIVYDDTYEVGNEESARVTLEAGKLMGLSVAYCDNDDPDEEPKLRDHFFGSVWVPAEAYNDHWMQADGYGSAKLVTNIETVVEDNQPANYKLAQVYPNPAGNQSTFIMNNAYRGEVQLALYNVLGQKVYDARQVKTGADFSYRLSLRNLTPGIYFVQARWGGQVNVQKLLVR